MERSKLLKAALLCGMAAAVLLTVAFSPVPPRMVVVIDAGHGGSDPGNLGTGRYKVTEKNVTLDVATKLRDKIAAAYPDVKIVMTRKDDSYPTLKDRVRIANEAQADLFISVHCDAFTKPEAIGASTFVMGMHKNEESLRVAMQENAAIYKEEDYEKRYEGFDPKDPDTYIALALRQSVFLNQSLEFGAHVQKEFRERVGRKDRGVKQAGYYVISFTTMPSVLVELGFLTNPTEEDFLNSPEGRVEMSDALFRAFRAYRSKYHPDVREVPVAVAPAVSTAPPPVVRGALPAESPVVYRVQILASATRVPMNDARLGGRSDVIEYLRDGMFKYAVGAATTPSAADKLKNDLRISGFPGCFVVAFQGEAPISMDAARRLTAGNR